MPYGIDLNQYNYRLRSKPRPHLIWLRAFHRLYNPSLIPAMLAYLVHDFPDVKIIMVGPDKDDGSFQDMQQKAIEFGVSDRIAIAGRIPKKSVPHWLQQGDIFVNTVNVDNTPVSIIEAMASGLCVASTNVGGLPYLLQHEHSGILVPPNDPEEMAAAVRSILTNTRLAGTLSRNGYYAAKGFDWSLVLTNWEKLFAEVARKC
jgi:glycosyltransferase involved in cell wall biosynthesis